MLLSIIDKMDDNTRKSGDKVTFLYWESLLNRVGILKKWKMVQEGDSILLGISGGADSVCLARYFLARREALSLKLYAVHINHMLRGEEAKRDEEFVQDSATSGTSR